MGGTRGGFTALSYGLCGYTRHLVGPNSSACCDPLPREAITSLHSAYKPRNGGTCILSNPFRHAPALMIGTTTGSWCARARHQVSARHRHGERYGLGAVTMSKQIKLSLFALVLLPLLAIGLFWRRPEIDTKKETLPDPRSEQVAGDAAPVALIPTATSPVAPSEHEATVGVAIEPALSLSAVNLGEARSRRFLERHPTFRRDQPSGCNPPYTLDRDGNKLYKKECCDHITCTASSRARCRLR